MAFGEISKLKNKSALQGCSRIDCSPITMEDEAEEL